MSRSTTAGGSRWVRAVVGGGALVALLSACGSTSPGAGSNSSSAGAGAGSGGSTTAPAACTLITQSEAAAVLGVSVTSQDVGPACNWSGASAEMLSVAAYAPGTDPKITVQGGHACNLGGDTPVSIGDVAVFCGDQAHGSGIAFAKKGILVQMQCTPGGSATACDKNAFISAAQAAAGRI